MLMGLLRPDQTPVNPSTDSTAVTDMYPLAVHARLFQYDTSICNDDNRTLCIGFGSEVDAVFGLDDDCITGSREG